MDRQVTVTHQPERARFVLDVDGTRAGVITYRLDGERMALLHTEIDPSMEREGLGSRLVKFVLDDARNRGVEVLPFCPFVSSFISQHRDYLELVPAEARPRFGL
jgi:predicted GNAT family acetyltransferase